MTSNKNENYGRITVETDYKTNIVPVGVQCKGCCYLLTMGCSRIGINGKVGVCWMDKSEDEY